MSQVNGVAKFSSAGIILEFESKLFGIISNGVKESRIALADILDITFKKGVFKRGARIEIRLNSVAKLAETPNKDGRITLKLFPADIDSAQKAVERLKKDIASYTAELPPPHSPIGELFDNAETKDLT